jgi:hypothetical protein
MLGGDSLSSSGFARHQHGLVRATNYHVMIPWFDGWWVGEVIAFLDTIGVIQFNSNEHLTKGAIRIRVYMRIDWSTFHGFTVSPICHHGVVVV